MSWHGWKRILKVVGIGILCVGLSEMIADQKLNEPETRLDTNLVAKSFLSQQLSNVGI